MSWHNCGMYGEETSGGMRRHSIQKESRRRRNAKMRENDEGRIGLHTLSQHSAVIILGAP